MAFAGILAIRFNMTIPGKRLLIRLRGALGVLQEKKIIKQR